MNENNTPSTLEIRDREHLKLLVIFHSAVAIVLTLFSAFSILSLHTVTSIFEHLSNVKHVNGTHTASIMPFSVLMIFATLVVSVPLFLSAHFMRHQQHRLFSLIVAGLTCFFAPLGTVLGVLTILVLTRDSVREAYR